MARVRQKPAGKKRERKTLVRGADGALYLLTDKDLAPFKLEQQKEKTVIQNLRECGHGDLVGAELSRSIIRDIQDMLHCWSTGATHVGIIVEL